MVLPLGWQQMDGKVLADHLAKHSRADILANNARHRGLTMNGNLFGKHVETPLMLPTMPFGAVQHTNGAGGMPDNDPPTKPVASFAGAATHNVLPLPVINFARPDKVQNQPRPERTTPATTGGDNWLPLPRMW